MIPIPLLDDWVLAKIKRHMVKDLFRRQQATSPEGLPLEVLSDSVAEWKTSGCLLGLIKLTAKVVLKFFWKFFRKILIFLAVKDSMDLASKTLHEGYLIQHAIRNPPEHLAGRLHDLEPASALRRAVDRTLEEVDARPLEKLLKQFLRISRSTLRKVLRKLVRGRHEMEDSIESNEKHLSDLVDQMAQEMSQQSGYFARLELCLTKNYDDAK